MLISIRATFDGSFLVITEKEVITIHGLNKLLEYLSKLFYFGA